MKSSNSVLGPCWSISGRRRWGQILKTTTTNTVFLLESELCLGKVSQVRKVLSLAHLATNETNKQEWDALTWSKETCQMFLTITDPGSPSLQFYFHPCPSSGRNSQEYCKGCHTAWKSGRNHRSNKFISIVTGSKPPLLPVEWTDLIHSSKRIHRNGAKKSVWESREIACSEIQGGFQVLTNNLTQF